MDILNNLESFPWCKPDWCYPSMSKETNELLRQCVDLPQVELCDDIEEIIKRSKAFPIPFPINTVREFGSNIEKSLYKDMSVTDFIERILNKRAVSFLGPRDRYQLITGATGSGGWESVGTLQQKAPLVLENCLSYDEMKLSSMLYVSGLTYCINDGRRRNSGVVEEEGVEEEAVIIGLIGPRFQRRCRMDNEDILITEEQNCIENGYGEEVTPTASNSAKYMWRKMWSEFYQSSRYTYDELLSRVTIQDKSKKYMERYVKKPKTEDIFDNEVYYKRICILAETTLMEAEYRASECGKNAFINVIGCGLGVWKTSPHQPDVYVLTFLERIRAFLKKDLLNHVTDVNFGYIKASPSIKALFTKSKKNNSSGEKFIFFESKRHPNGGIKIQLENREPSSKLSGEHAGKLLVMTYPWDGNAHPGNEFWLKKLSSSGDPAAACSTQVSELHNAYINTAVKGHNLRVAGRGGVRPLKDYCLALTSE
ncbi:unnamed protein product [Danaus chrysippus]|uniref:(African queen) hypothetical protein n=1 Tax=Danaus chrysippus TaxID=151541 RepID=A0A8J2R045_9NEOP|nr:unnamed protein product [Danaus chrysippus]